VQRENQGFKVLTVTAENLVTPENLVQPATKVKRDPLEILVVVDFKVHKVLWESLVNLELMGVKEKRDRKDLVVNLENLANMD